MNAGPIGIAALERSEGGFAMVALDQRESLRTLLTRDGTPASDDVMRGFKAEAAAALSPYASAVLLDRPFGLSGSVAPPLAPGSALILAADRFVQPAGEPVRSSDVDPEVTVELVTASVATALKLLVVWREANGRRERARTVEQFLALCAAAGVPGIVEGVVRPPGDAWGSEDARDDAIVAAAKEFGAHGPALYKAEVPGHGRGDLNRVRQRCAQITAALSCPWVVLSTGVAPDDFARAVEVACAGGASGFLAGRAIWSEAATSANPAEGLRTQAVGRLSRLLRAVPARRLSPGRA